MVKVSVWTTSRRDKYSVPRQLSRLANAAPKLKTLTVRFGNDEVDSLHMSMRAKPTAENIAQEIVNMWIACRESVPRTVKITMEVSGIDFQKIDHEEMGKALQRKAIDAGCTAEYRHSVASDGWKCSEVALSSPAK